MLFKKELEKPASHTSSSSSAKGHLVKRRCWSGFRGPLAEAGGGAAAEDMREEAFQAWTLAPHPKTQHSSRLHLRS